MVPESLGAVAIARRRLQGQTGRWSCVLYQVSLRGYKRLKENRVTETTNMDESNGTNLKPILPILFLNKLMNIGSVLVPSPDRWCERALGTSTKLSRKVLNPFTINSVPTNTPYRKLCKFLTNHAPHLHHSLQVGMPVAHRARRDQT
jgi:hypothetical protein